MIESMIYCSLIREYNHLHTAVKHGSHRAVVIFLNTVITFLALFCLLFNQQSL